jgi:Aspartate/tyrosine/aromatic aminotransferase
MKIAPFGVEQWMNEWEEGAVSNLAETCVDSLTVAELLDLAGQREEILERMLGLRLSYGEIKGSDELLDAVASLYAHQSRDNVIATGGGAAANFLSLYTLVEPGDEVVSVYPTYQQLYSIPESFGATVKLLRLKHEDGFLPDPEALERLVSPRTKVICINNSNNPTGSLMTRELLERIVAVARSVDAWIHCDEVYRFMAHDPEADVPSIADIYEKGVVSSSLSKCFSTAGLRIGWLIGPPRFIEDVFTRRDYTTISCGRLDDLLGRLAVQNRERIFARNRDIVRRGADILDRWVAREPRVDYARPAAGTTAFLRYDYDVASADFCERLYRRDGTFLLPGSCFGPEFDRYLRIGYAYEPENLEAGLAKVSAFLRELEGESR